MGGGGLLSNYTNAPEVGGVGGGDDDEVV